MAPERAETGCREEKQQEPPPLGRVFFFFCLFYRKCAVKQKKLLVVQMYLPVHHTGLEPLIPDSADSFVSTDSERKYP